jgi:hypothetical protein
MEYKKYYGVISIRREYTYMIHIVSGDQVRLNKAMQGTRKRMRDKVLELE